MATERVERALRNLEGLQVQCFVTHAWKEEWGGAKPAEVGHVLIGL